MVCEDRVWATEAEGNHWGLALRKCFLCNLLEDGDET